MEIISTKLVESKYGGKEYLLCTAEDGSLWTCEKDGSVFSRKSPSLKELSEKFKEQNG